MDSVIRAVIVYVLLLTLFRIAGKRSLAQVTTFDLVLSLIISEAIQDAMVDDDRSVTNAFLIVVTLVGMNILLSWAKQRSNRLQKLLEGTPVVLLEEGAPQPERMDKERVDEADILEAARAQEGIERLEGIRYAIIEKNGTITIIPRDTQGG
jgi:uncharacterized membrane protein YcaP (DUF421 family)